MDAMTALALGIAVGMTSIVVGYACRPITRAILPLRDPIFWAIVAVEVIIVIIASLTGTELPHADVIALCVISADCGYLIGYAIRRPGDMLYVDLGTSAAGSDVRPIVFYRTSSGSYHVPQTFPDIVKNLLGWRCELDDDLYMATQHRSISVTNGLIWLSNISCVPIKYLKTETVEIPWLRIWDKKDVNKITGEVTRIPRWLFRIHTERWTLRVADTTMADPIQFWEQLDIYKDAIASATEAEETAKRLELQMAAARYDAAAEMLAGLFDLTMDAPDAEDDLRRRIAEEYKRRDKEVTDGQHN